MRDITRPEVWAPDADMVEVVVDGTGTIMARSDGGWWWSEPLPPGTLYQFRIDGGMLLPDPGASANPTVRTGRVASSIRRCSTVPPPSARTCGARSATSCDIGTFTPEHLRGGHHASGSPG